MWVPLGNFPINLISLKVRFRKRSLYYVKRLQMHVIEQVWKISRRSVFASSERRTNASSVGGGSMAPLVFLCSQRKHTVKQFCQLWSSGTLIMKVSCTGSFVYLQDILKENTRWNSFVDYDPGWVWPACIVWRAKSVHFASWANFLVKVQTKSSFLIGNMLAERIAWVGIMSQSVWVGFQFPDLARLHQPRLRACWVGNLLSEGVAWVGIVRLRVRQLGCRHLANIWVKTSGNGLKWWVPSFGQSLVVMKGG